MSENYNGFHFYFKTSNISRDCQFASLGEHNVDLKLYIPNGIFNKSRNNQYAIDFPDFPSNQYFP